MSYALDDPLLRARGLVRVLGEQVRTTILHGIDVDVGRGELVSLTGPSGCGKSTLLHLLGALDRPDEGTVELDGVDLGALDDVGRSRLRNEALGFVFQFHFLLAEFSALENVMLPMLRQGIARAQARERAHEALTFLDIGALADRRPAQLSGGQQQRVSIARAVAHRPRLVLADEPTGNLDTANSERVMDLLEALVREQGLSVLMVTHEPELAARADRRIELRDGRVERVVVREG